MPVQPRVVFVHQGAELYGSDYVLLDIVSALSGVVEPLIVLDSDGPLVKKLECAGAQVSVRRLGVLRRKHLSVTGLARVLVWGVGSTLWLQRLIRDSCAALVYSNTIGVLSGAFAARIAGVPHIWHIHEIVTKPRSVSRILTILVSRFSDRVIANSHAVATHLQKDSRIRWRSDVAVIHNGTDSARFDAVEPQRIEQFRAEHNVPDRGMLVAVVGRVHHGKGQDVFIEAVRIAVEQGYRDLRTLIVGDVYPGYEELLSQLVAKVEEYGLTEQLRFCGYRQDVDLIMRSIDLLVLPSTSPEGFGLVLLEAMAAGKPVIATAAEGPLEIVADGVTGYLVPPNDAQALADKLMYFAERTDLREEMGTAGRGRFEKLFTQEHFAAKIRSTVTGVLHPSARDDVV